MSSTANDFIGWLSDARTGPSVFSGGKGANLVTMARSGLPVPDGFVVAAAAYRHFIAESSLAPLLTRMTDRLRSDPAGVEDVSATLRGAIEQAVVPAPLRAALAAAYARLGRGPVAVRSSATAEDLSEASFAGQLESVLNVAGEAELCDAVRRCWSSLWTARAMAYREEHGIGHADLAVAVVVQRMVPADVAGVLFTADPLSGRRDQVVIEAAAGLGEAVVSGHVTPDRWVLDAATRAVLTGPGPRRAGSGGAETRGPLLTGQQLDELVDLGLRAAGLFGCPQDVEWAVADGRCWLVQSRPITSLFPLPRPSPAEAGLRVYIPLMLVGQGIVEPLTPAGTAFFRALGGGWIGYWSAGIRRQDSEALSRLLPVVAGRLYCDVTPLLQRPRLAARIIRSLRMKDPAASTALQEWLEGNAARLPPPQGRGLVHGFAAWLPELLSGLAAVLVAPARTRRQVLARAERRLARLQRQAAELTTPRQQLEFVDRTVPAETLDLVMEQVPAVYGELLTAIGIRWLVKRWLSPTTALDPVLRDSPHDPTLAMGGQLARLAQHFTATGAAPSSTSPEINEFLAVFGHRAPDREVDLGLPRLADDPTYVVDLIHGLQGGPGRALTRFQSDAAQAATAADDLVAQVLRTKGPLRALLLRALISRHHELAGLRERPKFDLVRAIALARHTLRDVGAALVAQGLLDDADDVFFIDTTELRDALTRMPGQLRELAAANRRGFQRELRRRTIPRILVSDGETVYGPAAAAEGPGGLTGTPVSPGVHEGLVRVLDSPVGSGLRSGEVLVAASTDPGWTPLFLMAGALVMEVGGVISHGAVVAREYGIPAVAGIADATTRLRTGQRVRVDGENGTVTLLDAVGPVRPLPGSH